MLITRRPAGPFWKPVMGASVQFAPIDRQALRRARRAALKQLGRDEHEGQAEADAAEQLEELGDALSYALLVQGVLDWKDVCQQLLDDEGEPVLDGDGKAQFEPLAFSAENLAVVLSDPITFDAFDGVYVVPFASRERAKNGSAVSPNGIGEAAIAAGSIASSPARPKRRGAAKGARTAPKPRPTKKPRSSGTS